MDKANLLRSPHRPHKVVSLQELQMEQRRLQRQSASPRVKFCHGAALRVYLHHPSIRGGVVPSAYHVQAPRQQQCGCSLWSRATRRLQASLKPIEQPAAVCFAFHNAEQLSARCQTRARSKRKPGPTAPPCHPPSKRPFFGSPLSASDNPCFWGRAPGLVDFLVHGQIAFST